MKITTFAPCRISIFGGGTDVGYFAKNYGGAIINFAISLGTTVTYNNGEWTTERNFNGSGLGGSASLWVAWLGVFNEMNKMEWTRKEIAEKAFKIESEIIGWEGGKQDQYASVYGGLNLLYCNEDVLVTPLPSRECNKLMEWIVLCRAEINRPEINPQKGLTTPSRNQLRALHNIKLMTFKALKFIEEDKYLDIAKLLHLSWEEKKKSNKVSSPELDKLYNRALNIGATGGKLVGAGQGGHFVFMVEPKRRQKFIKNLPKGLEFVNFKPNWTGLEVK